MNAVIRPLVTLLILSFVFSTAPAPAFATRGYEADVTSKSLDVQMTAGERKTVILSYKNVGDLPWYRSGVRSYVSLYLVGKSSSVVHDSSWRHNESPALITETSVPRGSTGTVKFHVYASKPGTYTETFRLAAEDTAWMYGGETKITFHIKEGYKHPSTLEPGVSANPAPALAPAPVSSDPTAQTAPVPVESAFAKLSTILLLRSAKEFKLGGDDTATVTLGFKNTGNVAWSNASLLLADVRGALSGSQSVYHASWPSASTAVRSSEPTQPGEIGFLSFTFNAPSQRGNYMVRMQLMANGERPVDGGYVELPVTVTSDGTVQLTPPITPPASGVMLKHTDFQTQEPIIRVGIFATTDDQMMVTSLSGRYKIHQNGRIICEFTSGEVVTIRFDRTNKVYKATGPRCTSQSTDPYQVQSMVGPWEPLEMTDFNRPVGWLPGANDNTFRGILELRWSEANEDVWTINELPIEMYLRGIAETSDVSPMEYQKALLIAARTYAYYHWTRGTKHAAKHFHLDAKYDQVYRGYGAEARSPKIVEAVEATRGQIVTYDGALAITPYFSRSDGRTRDWEEVWGGGPIDWLRSVPVPQDAGRTLWGHGVGMSATGALGMAREGVDYQSILKHFYTGTELMLYY